MREETREFDAVRYLDCEEMRTEYLNAALEDGNPELLLATLSDIAKARGMTQIANAAGLGSTPRYDTAFNVMKALGVKLHATAA